MSDSKLYRYYVETVYSIHAADEHEADNLWQQAMSGDFSDEVTISKTTMKKFYWNTETKEWFYWNDKTREWSAQ